MRLTKWLLNIMYSIVFCLVLLFPVLWVKLKRKTKRNLRCGRDVREWNEWMDGWMDENRGIISKNIELGNAFFFAIICYYFTSISSYLLTLLYENSIPFSGGFCSGALLDLVMVRGYRCGNIALVVIYQPWHGHKQCCFR